MREQLKAWGHRVEFGRELRHILRKTPRTVTAYVAGAGWRRGHHRSLFYRRDGGAAFVRKEISVSFSGHTLGIHALVHRFTFRSGTDVWHHLTMAIWRE